MDENSFEISFDPLWKTLFERKLSKGDLAKLTGLSSTTIAKMGKGESVTLEVVGRICTELKIPIEDYIQEQQQRADALVADPQSEYFEPDEAKRFTAARELMRAWEEERANRY